MDYLMGIVTINSGALIKPTSIPTQVIFNLTGSEVGISQTVLITDSYGTNIMNPYIYPYPPGLIVTQPLFYDITGAPNLVTITNVVMTLGTGAVGNLLSLSFPAGVPLTYPTSYPLVALSNNTIFEIGVDNFTPGTTETIIEVTYFITDTNNTGVSIDQKMTIKYI